MDREATQPIRVEHRLPQAGKTRLRLTVPRTWRGDPHSHAVSLACAAFFVRAERLLQTVFSANGPSRLTYL